MHIHSFICSFSVCFNARLLISILRSMRDAFIQFTNSIILLNDKNEEKHKKIQSPYLDGHIFVFLERSLKWLTFLCSNFVWWISVYPIWISIWANELIFFSLLKLTKNNMKIAGQRATNRLEMLCLLTLKTYQSMGNQQVQFVSKQFDRIGCMDKYGPSMLLLSVATYSQLHCRCWYFQSRSERNEMRERENWKPNR